VVTEGEGEAALQLNVKDKKALKRQKAKEKKKLE